MTAVETPASSSTLLHAVRNNDPEAWRRLISIYGPTVYQWGRRAGLQAADAANVLQEVFASVNAGIAQIQWDRPGDTFRGWLWTIFHSRLMDFFRQRQRAPQPIGDSKVKGRHDNDVWEPPPTTSISDPDENAALVRRALRTIQGDFSERTWQAFWRSTVEDQATSDIARDLGISPAAVCMCRSRVLVRLRETLAGLWLPEGGD